MTDPDKKTVETIYNQIDTFFMSLGKFKKFIINDKANYLYKDHFYRINFVSSIGFIIEYAGDFQDAIRNVYEDGDTFPLSLGENLLDVLKEYITKYYEFGSTEE